MGSHWGSRPNPRSGTRVYRLRDNCAGPERVGMGGVHLTGPAGFQPYLLGQPPPFLGAQPRPGQLHRSAPRLHDYAADLDRADRYRAACLPGLSVLKFRALPWVLGAQQLRLYPHSSAASSDGMIAWRCHVHACWPQSAALLMWSDDPTCLRQALHAQQADLQWAAHECHLCGRSGLMSPWPHTEHHTQRPTWQWQHTEQPHA